MDGKTFAKIARDYKLIDKKLTPADVDLTFAKVKTDRKICFNKFISGIEILSDKKGIPVDELA